MVTYVLLMRAVELSAGNLLGTGAKGAKGQEQFIEAVGGKVIKQYAVLGQYDLVVVAEFPNDESCYAAALVWNAHGLYTEPLRAFSPEEIDKAVESSPNLQGAASLFRTTSETSENTSAESSKE